MMLCLNLSDVVIIAVNGVNYSCIIYNISKSEAMHFLENSVFDSVMGIYKKCISKKSTLKIESTTITLTNWSKQKRLKTKNILID